MKFEPKEITLKDGRKCILRSVSANDAEALVDYCKVTAGETPFLTKYPDEVNYTVEGEAKMLQDRVDSPTGFMIIPEVDGEICGNVGVSKIGSSRRSSHRAGIGIALYKKFWGLGIASAAFEYGLELIERLGYEQAELAVVDGNDRAIAMYEKFGFEKSGRYPNALKYDDGTYRDEIFMIKTFKK